MPNLKEKIDQLPPEYQKEVNDFIEFLLEKKVKKDLKKPDFKWAGALRDLRNKYSSVDLQHKILELRSQIK